MKLLTILIFTGSMAMSANTYSQKTKIDLQFQNLSLTEILSSIEEKSEFIFIYNANVVNTDVKRSIHVKDEKIEKVLELLFEGIDVTYRVDDRQIFLYKKKDLKKIEMPDEKIKLDQPADQPQKKTVQGKVTDAKGQSIPGTTVLVKDTNIGTVTNPDGLFTLEIPVESKILAFSFVGYEPQEILIGNKNRFDIILEEMTIGLEEVVAVGYGTQKKESVVGAIAQVNNDVLIRGGNTNVSNAMTGKLSGVIGMQETGEPGKDQSEIIVRGLSSWNGSAPLVLVDGVERDFNNLDPNEINTISVLKDASATAVFGAKGANGVILVTTKRGVQSKPKLEFSASMGLQRATESYEFVDSYTTMSMLNVAYKNGQQFSDVIPDNILNEYRDPSTPLSAIRYPSVNWYKELTRTFAPTYTGSLSVRGGTNFVKYFSSIGYTYQGSFFKGYHDGYVDTRYKYNRVNYRSNLDFNLSKTTQLSFTIGGDIDIKNSPGTSPWKGIFQSSPARFPMVFPAWVLNEVPDTDYPDASGERLAQAIGEQGGNPYSILFQGTFNRELGTTLFTDAVFEQKLDFILKGLSFRGKASLSTYYASTILKSAYDAPEYQLNFEKIGTGENPWVRQGETNEVYRKPLLNLTVGELNSGYYTDMYYETSLNYANTFGNHNVTALALLNLQEKDRGTQFPYYNAAVVGRATYDYSHKYLFELNLGYTGSERFAPGNRFGFFPAAAFGWVISEEAFFKEAVPWMNKLKLRYSDGLVGSDQANNRWLYISDYWVDDGGYIHESAGANKNVQWEESRKRDIGIEIGLFKNIFKINVDLFDEYRSKMLLEPRGVTFLVGAGFKELNLGKMKKHGIEAEIEFNKTLGSGLSYFATGLFAFNENRIIFKDDPIYSPDYTKNAGKPIDAQLSGTTTTGTGYYTTVDDIHNNPSPIPVMSLITGDYKFLDYNADGTVSNLDLYPIKGTTYPPITYSFSGGFSYKSFNFSFMLQGDHGKYVEYNQAFETEFFIGAWSVHQSALDYWTPDNQDATHANLHFSTQQPAILAWGGGGGDAGYSYYLKDHFWRDASYLRLKELNFGYTFASNGLKMRTGLSSLMVYVQANNLWTITPLIEGDPERKVYSYSPGSSVYPQMATVRLGVKLGF